MHGCTFALRCVGVNSPEYSLSLVTDSDEDGARLLALLGVEPEEDLDENAFSNTAPVKRESKKSPGVATLMHGGMDFTAHFSHKPSTQLRVRNAWGSKMALFFLSVLFVIVCARACACACACD